MVEHLLAGVSLPSRTGDPVADLRAIADAFRVRALLHPEVAHLVLTRQLNSFEGRAPGEALLAVLRSAG
ncbi:hypothetical protein [Streptomyces sp. NPDC096142]|uniref:hypothetical protein n=1 Tax=Streptomyces sp. NPDC096142 TaxID=3366077 RepID=UPI0037F5458D